MSVCECSVSYSLCLSHSLPLPFQDKMARWLPILHVNPHGLQPRHTYHRRAALVRTETHRNTPSWAHVDFKTCQPESKTITLPGQWRHKSFRVSSQQMESDLCVQHVLLSYFRQPSKPATSQHEVLCPLLLLAEVR